VVPRAAPHRGNTGSITIGPGEPAPRWVRFDQPSAFGRVLVVDEGELRHLRFGSADGDDQSTISLADPGAVPMECIRHALLGLLLTRHVQRALLIGLGGGSYARLLQRAHPTAQIEAVEINPVVVAAARRYFGLKPGPLLRVHVEDGAAFVGRSPAGSYDVIFLDAYDEQDDPPAQLATPAFYRALRARLAPGGVVVVNLSAPDATVARLRRSFFAAFSGCASVQGVRDQNVVVFGGADALPAAPELLRRARAISGLSVDLAPLVARLRPERCR